MIPLLVPTLGLTFIVMIDAFDHHRYGWVILFLLLYAGTCVSAAEVIRFDNKLSR